MLIKVCGLTNLENITQVMSLGVDMIGLNFYKPSPRFVNMDNFQIEALVNLPTPRVGVFVNETLEEMIDIITKYRLDFVQLHGDESVETAAILKDHCKVIKVVGVENEDDIKFAEEISDVHCLLFDKKSPLFGGTGLKFNWNLLSLYKGHLPFLLAGGIGINDIEAINNIDNEHFIGLDLNSKFELSPGLKDVSMIEDFQKSMNKVK